MTTIGIRQSEFREWLGQIAAVGDYLAPEKASDVIHFPTPAGRRFINTANGREILLSAETGKLIPLDVRPAMAGSDALLLWDVFPTAAFEAGMRRALAASSPTPQAPPNTIRNPHSEIPNAKD